MKTAEQQLEYYHNHPPSCLSGFTVRPTILAHFGYDGHGGPGTFPYQATQEPSVFFQIRCQCGGKQFFLLTEADQHEPGYLKGLLMGERYSLTCADCGKKTPLFDLARHGYNSEVVRKEGQANNSDKQSVSTSMAPKSAMYACANCEAHIVGVVIFLDYPDELLDSSSANSDFVGSEQDLFSWFTIVAICPTCSAVSIVADFECD